MKKILWLGIILGLFFIFPHSTIAAIRTYTFKDANPGTILVNSGTSATFHVTFPIDKHFSYFPAICISVEIVPCDSQSVAVYRNQNIKEVSKDGKAQVWDYTFTKFDPKKTYYLTLLGAGGYKNPIVHEFFTGNDELTDIPVITTSKDSDTSDIIATTTVDTVKFPDYRELSASLIYSENKDLSDPKFQGYLPGRDGPSSDSHDGININSAPGTFYWRLKVGPNTRYYYQVTITVKGGGSIKSTVNYFDSTQGVTVAVDSAASAADDLKHGYKLLSGFPGFTFLPDPQLCAQQRAAATAAGKLGPKYCDLNDVLNYFLQLMIGISAVILVFRLMYEGYIYMVSDVPFLKASAKSGFFSALLGLLLALSSYVILNTINPKLVNESVGLTQLNIGINTEDDIVGRGVPIVSTGSGTGAKGSGTNRNGGPVTLALKGGGKVSVSNCDTSQIATIPGTVFGKSGVQVQKNLVASVQRINAAWQKMNPQYPVKVVEGYNCRPIAGRTTASYHGYGMALDINPDTNGRGTKGDMPQSFRDLWTAEGWGWGGVWGYTDPMHFSKGSNEYGNLQGE
jgi:hypothetical protein